MNAVAQPVPNRILVVTLAELGDALLTTPALYALRQALPHAHIDVLTTPAGAKALGRTENREPRTKKENLSIVPFDDLIIFAKHRLDTPRALLRPANLRYAFELWRQLRGTRYDACVMLHHLTTWFGTLKYAALAAASGAPHRYGLDNGRGFFLTHRVPDHGFGFHHQVEYWLQVVAFLGAQGKDMQPSFNVTADDRHHAQELLAARQPPASSLQPPVVALHPGTGAYSLARRWPPQRWATLADALIDDGVQVVLVGGAEEVEVRRSMLGAMRHAQRVLDLGGRTTLGQLAAVLERCDLFVGNDSGVAHLAGSVGTSVVGVFGPTDPRAWGPYGGESWHSTHTWPNGVEVLRSGPHQVLKAAIACSPCIYRGHELGSRDGCPDRTCLLRIDVAQVLALVREQLRELQVDRAGA